MHIDLFVFVLVFVFALWLSWHIINAQLKTFTWPRNATTLHNNTTALPGCLCVTLVARLPDRLAKRERQSGRAGERKRATEQLGRHFKIVKLTHRQAHTHTHTSTGKCRHSHTDKHESRLRMQSKFFNAPAKAATAKRQYGENDTKAAT